MTFLVLGLVIILTACSTPSADTVAQPTVGYELFSEAIDAGAECPRLFDIRNDIRRATTDAALEERLNDELRQLGCLSSTSKRTDDGVGLSDLGYSAEDYSQAYSLCASDPDAVFAEARSADPEKAAEWYADGSTGSTALAGYAGCLDALSGQPSRFP